MATDDQELSRQARFEKYNPYAGPWTDRDQTEDPADVIGIAVMAVAFELAQLRTEIHFAAKRGKS